MQRCPAITSESTEFVRSSITKLWRNNRFSAYNPDILIAYWNKANALDFAAMTIDVAPKKDREDTWEWHIKDTERRTLPLTAELVRLLVEHQMSQSEGCPYIFAPMARYKRIQEYRQTGQWDVEKGRSPLSKFCHHFNEIRDLASIRTGTFHDLRRTSLSNWIVQGLSLHEVTGRLASREQMLPARRLAEIELQMFVTDAFFHADLHPGNILFKPDGRIVILDVGMVGQIEPMHQDRFLCYWIAVTRNQRQRALHHLLEIMGVKTNTNLPEFQRRYAEILDRFYGARLSERSMAQTYLEILMAASECSINVPSEMVLQAKALVTAEALDLVLYPDFQFTEEARPIVARELAKRIRPNKIFDRIWSGMAEYILLGESPPAGPVATEASLDERLFRRALLKAAAYEWADYADEKLRRWQGDVTRYTSAGYWKEHPELYSAVKTTLGILKLMSLQIDRALQASEAGINLDSAQLRAYSPTVRDETQIFDDGKARYRAFYEELHSGFDNEHAFTEDLRRILDYWESQTREFTSETFWRDKKLLQSALKTGLSLFCLLASLAGQAVEAREREKQRNDFQVLSDSR